MGRPSIRRMEVGAADGEDTADDEGDDRPPVPAAVVPVAAAGAVQVGEVEHGAADDPVVGDQDARDRAEQAADHAEPGEDVDLGSGVQLPREDQDADDTGDQRAGPEVDDFRGARLDRSNAGETTFAAMFTERVATSTVTSAKSRPKTLSVLAASATGSQIASP